MSNVSSVDLDELRKAREELNKEIGVDNDPNMYSDYNPNREVENESQTKTETAETNENNYKNITSEISDESFSSEKDNSSKDDFFDSLINDSESNPLDENPDEAPKTELSEQSEEHHSSSEENLGKYDAFAAFEIKENAVQKPAEPKLEKIIDAETSLERTTNLEKLEKELLSDNLETESEETIDSDSNVDTIDNVEELEALLNNLLESISEDRIVKTSEESEEKEDSLDMLSALANVDVEPKFEETENSEPLSLEDLEKELLADESDVENAENEEVEQPVRKDVLSALMNRNTGVSVETSEEPAEENKEEAYSDDSLNLETFAVNDNVENEESFDVIEKPQELVEINVDPVEKVETEIAENSVEDEIYELEKTNEESENQVADVLSVESAEETSSEEDEELNPLDENPEDEIEEKEESEEKIEDEEPLDVGIKDIGRILGRKNEFEEEKEEFVETTEYYDPSKARPSNKPKLENKSSEDTEIITDYNQLREILQKELKESELAEQEKIEEIVEEDDGIKYPLIEEFKFINEIASDEFKNSDKFSYIMGKNESGEIVYGNFREHHNLAVFCKNELVTKSFLNSLVLSLCLKNNVTDVNFVMIDSDINSSFEVYNKSSHLYFNRIAKTNKEILDTLIEITKELDARYEKLANAGMSGIDQFNDMAHETQTTPMPHLIIVFNNYTDVSQATYADKINACLYQILKFGRIVGIFVVLTAMLPIENSQVNYNLSSRLSFKSDQDSKYTVGVEGVEKLPDEADAIYFNIAKNTSEHIKAATVTDTELDLIIKELEDES